MLGAYTFAAMALPGVALVSSRRPWWVIFPAAGCEVTIFWLGHFESEGVGLRGTLPTARSSFGEPTESTEGRHRTISPMRDDALISPRSRLSLWLDSWCASPWRAFLTWTAISIVCFYLIQLGLSDWIYRTAGIVERQINTGSLIPNGMLQKLWAISTLWMFFTWFQPVVLRLPFWRGIAWLCIPLIIIIAFAPTNPDPWALRAYGFAIAASPGVALIRERSRWWVIFPAAACDAAAATDSLDGNNWWIGSLVYAAIILFGTRKISAPEIAVA